MAGAPFAYVRCKMTVINTVKHWWKARVAENQLARLTDAELKDIGILRSEIRDVAHGRVALH